METTTDLISADLSVDGESHSYLKESARWAKFLGIFGFVYSAIIAIVAFYAGFFLSTLASAFAGGAGLVGGGAITVIYLGLAAVTFFISLFLYKFGIKTQAALKVTDQPLLNNGLRNLNLYFRTIGILTVIMLSFILLAVIGGIAVAAFNS